MAKTYYVYILTNPFGNVMYVGVTNDLARRMDEHRSNSAPGFTKKYNAKKLVYMESCGDVDAAIAREKQIKSYRRDKKNRLVEAQNPEWRDLAVDWGVGINLSSQIPLG